MNDPLLGSTAPQQPEKAPEPMGTDNSKPTSMEDRAQHLSKLAKALAAEIMERTATLGESMYLAHAIYDEILFRAVSKVTNTVVSDQLMKLVKGLMKQGVLRQPGQP